MPENRVDRSQKVPRETESDNGLEAVISLWDLDLKLLDSSKKFKEHIDVASRNDLTLWEAYPALAKPALATLIRQVIDSGKHERQRSTIPIRENATSWSPISERVC
jgi:hypothetical protein